MQDIIEIEYRFQCDSGLKDAFTVALDPSSLKAISNEAPAFPAWTELNFHQCPNCPLNSEKESKCPAAVNMIDLVKRFDQLLSFDKALVAVTTSERIIYSHTTVQRGVCSLMGLLMASSGCPLTAFFKPMARFHLPFASTEETIWRASAAYLMAQYFRQQLGKKPDVHFNGLTNIYKGIQKVNLAFAKRLRSACRQDSMVNAIILLDMFAKSMPPAIEESLDEIRQFFLPYLKHVELQ